MSILGIVHIIMLALVIILPIVLIGLIVMYVRQRRQYDAFEAAAHDDLQRKK